MTASAPMLKTRRLELEPCRRDLLAEIHAIWTGPEMRRFLFDGREISCAEAAAFVDASIANFARFGYGLWLVSESAGEALVGFAGLLRSAEETPSLVYGVCQESCGRGYATEAASAVLGHSFGVLHLPRIVADVDEPNVASVHILEKLGMSRVGRGIVDGRPLLYFAIGSGSSGGPPR